MPKKNKQYYDVQKLRADFLTFQVIEHDASCHAIAKKLSISKHTINNIRKGRPISLSSVFYIANKIKKPISNYLLQK